MFMKNLTDKKAGILFGIAGALFCVLGFSLIISDSSTLGTLLFFLGVVLIYAGIKLNKKVLIAVLICIAIAFIATITMCAVSGNDKDGIKKCKNCGRSEVVLFGMCNKCADGFLND